MPATPYDFGGGGGGKRGYSTLYDVRLPPPPAFPDSFAQQWQLWQPAVNEKRRESEGGGQHYYNWATNPAWQNAGRQVSGLGSAFSGAPSEPAWNPPPNAGDWWLPDEGGGGHWVSNGAPALSWDQKYNVAGAPAWWRGVVPSALDPNTEYVMLMNSLIPYMSPEDQRTAASNLARVAAASGGPTFEAFKGYDPAAAGFANAPIPPQMTGDIRNQFTGQERAKNILSTLDQLATLLGKSQTDFGPGYGFLRSLASLERDFGGTQTAPQTRQQYLQELSALDPLLAETKGQALAPYAPSAQAIAQPFFSGGGLRNYTRDQGGKFQFGSPNKRLFG